MELTDELTVQNYSAAYYDRRYTGYGLRYHTDLIDWLMKESQGEILDAGCGNGIVSSLYPNKNILGIDLSEGMLAKHPGRHERQDVTKLPWDWGTRFDFILCRSLLHHLPNHVYGLAEMRRVLKPKGKIAFLETNKSAIATFVRKYTQHGDRFSAYHHAFTDTDLLHDIGQWFTITEMKYVGYLAYPLFGFPDILPIADFIPCKRVFYPMALAFDELLSRIPAFKRLSWALAIRATK